MADRDLEFILRFKDEATRALRQAAQAIDTVGKASGRAQKTTLGLGKSLQQVGASAQRIGSRLREVGTTASFALTAPIAGAAAAATKSFLDFELGLIGVQKTTNASRSQVQALGQQFIDLSDRIPTSTAELNRLGEVAGQLGTDTGDIAKLAETAVRLGVSVEGLTAESAIVTLSRFSNITGTAEEDVDRLGSTVIELGNNFAAFEGEILDIGLRLAAAGRRAGLTEGEILGIGTALVEVGVQAQVGGTSISKVLDRINLAVAQGGKELQVFAETAGTSTQEFSQLFERDAAGALVSFVQGLRDLEDAGGESVLVLEELGLSDQRLIRAIGGLVGNVDGLKDALNTGNQAFEENVALTRESDLFFGALSNQLKVLGSQFKNTLTIIGQAFRPVIEEAFEAIGSLNERIRAWAREFENASPAVKRTTVIVAGLVAAIGPLLVVLGSFGILLGGVTQALGTFVEVLKPLGKALKALRLAAFLTTPLGLAVAAITAVGVGLFALKDTVVEFGGETATVGELAVAAFDLIVDALEPLGRFAAETFAFVKRVGAEAFEFLQPIVVDVFTFVKDVITERIGQGIKVFQLAGLAFETAFRLIAQVAVNVFGILKGVFEDIKGLLEPVFTAFTGVFSSVSTFVGGVFTRLRESASRFFGETKENLRDLAEQAGTDAVQGLEDLGKALSESAEGGNLLAQAFEGTPEILKESLQRAGEIIQGDPLGDIVGAVWGRALSNRAKEVIVEENPVAAATEDPKFTQDADDKARTAGKNFGTEFAKGFNNAREEFIKNAQDIAARTEEAFTTVFDGLSDAILDFVETGKFSFKDFGLSIVRTLTELGIKSLLADVLSVAGGGGTSSTGLIGGIAALAGAFSEGGYSDSPTKMVAAPARAFRNPKKFRFGGTTSGGDTIPALLSPGEAVVPLGKGRAIPVEMNGGGGGQVVNINVQAQDVESFSRSRDQFLAGVSDAIGRANRRNN